MGGVAVKGREAWGRGGAALVQKAVLKEPTIQCTDYDDSSDFCLTIFNRGRGGGKGRRGRSEHPD